MSESIQPALIAFGSNVGDSAAAYEQVKSELGRVMDLVKASEPIETPPVSGEKLASDADEQEDYLNAAMLVKVQQPPQELMNTLLEIEQSLGRVRDRRWGPRTVDLDLLLYGDQQIQTDHLLCPHPRMSFRRFVLQPASQVAPNMIHPPSGCTIAELLDRLDSRPNLVLWAGAIPKSLERVLHEHTTPLGVTLKVIAIDQWFENVSGIATKQTIVCPVTEPNQLNLYGDRAKLVVVPHRTMMKTGRESEKSIDEAEVARLIASAAAFPGATLQLNSLGLVEQAEQTDQANQSTLADRETAAAIKELSAAIDAMQ